MPTRGGGSSTGNKNRTAYWIKRKGREKFEDTAPEIALDKLADYMGLKLVKPTPIWVLDDRGNLYHLRPDRRIDGTRIMLHVDGHPSHFTPTGIRKGDWEDRSLNVRGFRNLRIPGELLLHEKYWWFVGWTMRCFMYSGKHGELPNYRIPA